MPIGKDSITKRVAKQAEPEKTTEKNIAPELVATSAAAPKATAKKAASTAAKKPATSSAKKPTNSSAKKPAASTSKKPAAKKPVATKKETLTPPTEAPSTPLVDTAVLANVSPETVAAVTGHKENSGFEKVQVGEKMPVHLL